MTEFYEDEYEDDLYDEIAELRAQVEAQQQEAAEVEEINDAIAELQNWHGDRFTFDQVQQLGALIDQGYDPEQAYDAVSPDTDVDRDAQSWAEWIEEKEGRTLTEPELDHVWQATEDGEEEVEVFNLDSTEGRRDFMAQRVKETHPQQPAETPDEVETPPLDATAEEGKQYMRDRLNGAEVSDWPFQSPADSGVSE